MATAVASTASAPILQRVPPGDSLPRYVCDNCGTIHYQNPKIVVAVFVLAFSFFRLAAIAQVDVRRSVADPPLDVQVNVAGTVSYRLGSWSTE